MNRSIIAVFRSFDLSEACTNYEKRTVEAAKRRSSGGSRYRMVLPPPNVTGNLHLGHAFTVAIQDSICRSRRMFGADVSWIPGFDHAGIATQTVVERQLWKEKKLRRHEISDEEFLEFCGTWKDDRVENISAQLKRLGATLDWEQRYYTMDEVSIRVTVAVSDVRIVCTDRVVLISFEESIIFNKRKTVIGRF
ncbi:hypothetical protein L596_029472 [Steinernema carpocapsae]|uniref:valine--tRNA ligase n=1 Tax=Steinernema carpocapsae TaxID=34508 RepID=A0A4U5LUR4_STECR|nr:hypothetical protein L596_029472 [Steinernema carpocapsae]